MDEQLASRGPDRTWTLFGYRFERYGFRPRRRWGCNNGKGRGVDMHRNPLFAFLALRRWEKEPAPLEGGNGRC